MLRYARENAPAAEFVLADARSFAMPANYHGVVSVFDSLNHIMHLDELTLVFGNVHSVLREGGRFLFDLNMEEKFKVRWRGAGGHVEDDHAYITRSVYREDDRIGPFDITIFRLQEGWQRSDLTLLLKCYSEEEVFSALESVGFADIQTHYAEEMIGRTFFVCHKPAAF